MLWKCLDDLENLEISEKLKILEKDFLTLQYSFPQYCCQQQLYNIQNSTTHYSVMCALDFLIMLVILIADNKLCCYYAILSAYSIIVICYLFYFTF